MTSPTEPSRRRLLVGAGVGAAAVAMGAVPAFAGIAKAQSSSGNLSSADLQLTLFHRSIELALVELYGQALDKGLLDDEQSAAAAQFRDHHREHAAGAAAIGGVGVVSANGQLVNSYTGRIRAASTVEALADVLFEIETRSASMYLQACGTYESGRAAGFASSVLAVEAQHATVVGRGADLPTDAVLPSFDSVVGAFTPEEFPVLT